MKKMILLVFSLCLISAWSMAVTIDGTTTGDGYGAAIATGSDSGWATVALKGLFVTQDVNSVYFCATGDNMATWQSAYFYIYAPGITTFSGATEADQWARQLDAVWTPNRPNVQVHMNLNAGWLDIDTWNGSSWNVSANILPYAINLGGGTANGFEVAIAKSLLGITGNQSLNVEAIVTGDVASQHGCFDSIPNGVNADAWDVSQATGDKTGPNNESVYATAAVVPVELSVFSAE